MILEYMLEKNHVGMMTPPWVETGGHFFDEPTNTYIGWTPELADREYYVPDSVTTLTRAELLARVLASHAVANETNSDNNAAPMTEAEVTVIVNDWCDSHGQT
jgi:hypothetical protein|tara:strand:- start:885 stop:1193 length:309 start_codon:yes stop_codon:yes gene_type:complete